MAKQPSGYITERNGKYYGCIGYTDQTSARRQITKLLTGKPTKREQTQILAELQLEVAQADSEQRWALSQRYCLTALGSR